MSINVSNPSIEDLGWRQCSIIVGSDLPGLAEMVKEYQNDDIFIVLPYSCAVVQMDVEKEPYIELFRVRRASGVEKEYQFGRNPRLLQIEVQGEGELFFATGSIHDRFFIDRSVFSGLKPDSTLKLNERECVIVKNWFAKRYIRNAFPTEFNTRTRAATRKLNKAMKGDVNLEELIGVYLLLDPLSQELNNLEEPYDVEIYFLVKESGLKNNEIIRIKDKFKADLGKCAGILISEIELKSETEILLSEYRDLIRLDDYDFISHRDDHDDPIVT